eukprot:2804627-Lingulodinium_polyedra.AAC.1
MYARAKCATLKRYEFHRVVWRCIVLVGFGIARHGTEQHSIACVAVEIDRSGMASHDLLLELRGMAWRDVAW